MDPREKELAEAAASLNPEDLQYLQQHNMIPGPDTYVNVQSRASTQVNGPSPPPVKKKKGKRRHIAHQWPPVGSVIEADYQGTHYEAQIIPMPRFKSGKSIKILNGPAQGTVSRSFTGAMLRATEKQREENGLGRKGVSNGWDFWRVKSGGIDET
jgi:hypothetical protein